MLYSLLADVILVCHLLFILFVIFGAFLELSGATQFIVDLARYVFGRSPGGPAKGSVLASGLMGSLSGSAVANAVTTGAFTIPMKRSAGFRPLERKFSGVYPLLVHRERYRGC